jgi:hypothetical protein
MGRARRLKEQRRWERSDQGQVVGRLMRHLAWADGRYPHGWASLAASRARDPHEWPAWCWCPASFSLAIAEAEIANWDNDERDADGFFSDDYFALISDEKGLMARTRAGRYGAVLAALAAWRETKGVYWFDRELLAALEDTTLDADIPAQVLLRLPEWCLYVATQAGLTGRAETSGFYSHLDWTSEPVLRLVFDQTPALDEAEMAQAWAEARAEDPTLPAAPPTRKDILAELAPAGIALGADSISAALYAEERARADTVAEVFAEFGDRPDPHALAASQVARAAARVRHAVSALLYLCSSEPDLGDPQVMAAPERDRARRPLEPELVPVGWVVGQALRAGASTDAEARSAHNDVPDASVRHRPRPHVRRAHWHTYWLGPRSRPDERHTELRWVPPIPVGTADPGELVPTLRPVDGPAPPASA